MQREIKSCLTSKLMHNAEIRTIAKPLPLLRRETHKMLILSYSVYISGIFQKKISRVELLGYGKIPFTRTVEGLILTLPSKRLNDIPQFGIRFCS